MMRDDGIRSGLQTRIGATEKALLCVQMKRLTAFVELQSAIRESLSFTTQPLLGDTAQAQKRTTKVS